MADTHIKIGILCEELQDYNKAMQEYDIAMVNNQDNHKLFQHKAWCSLKMGNIDKALQYINRAEELQEGHADTAYIKGRCFFENG